MTRKLYSLRLWPNGEFSIGTINTFRPKPALEGKDPEPPSSISWTPSEVLSFIGLMIPRGYSLKAILSMLGEKHIRCLQTGESLGSSELVNSHKVAKRGTKGLTSMGKKMLRNGCYLLEKRAGRHRVAMVTTTIPSGASEVVKDITREWPEIVRTFTQFISRRLRAAHGCPWVVGCVEIQEKRLEKFGGMPLHLHLVFQSRVKREYILSKSDVLDAWKRAVCSRVPSAESLNWRASTRIEQVKKSVTNYMCKYMSKGINQNVLVSVNEGYTLPSSWWFIVGGLKREIKRKQIYNTSSLAVFVLEQTRENKSAFKWLYNIAVSREGGEYIVGIAGQFKEQALTEIRKVGRLLKEINTGDSFASAHPRVLGS